MRDYAECKPFLDYLAAEHRRLHQAVLQVEQGLKEKWRERDRVWVKERLTELRRQLQEHFVAEEAGGCLEEAVCRCPTLSPQVAILQHQHASMLEEIDTVIARVDAGTPGVEGVVSHSFTQLIQRIEEHERAENHVLERAFGSDQGNYDGPAVS